MALTRADVFVEMLAAASYSSLWNGDSRRHKVGSDCQRNKRKDARDARKHKKLRRKQGRH